MSGPEPGQTVGEKVVVPLHSQPEELYRLVVDIYEALKDNTSLEQAISEAAEDGDQLAEPDPVSPALGLVESNPLLEGTDGSPQTLQPRAGHGTQQRAPAPSSPTPPCPEASPAAAAAATGAGATETVVIAVQEGDGASAAAEFERELLAAEAAGRAAAPTESRESQEDFPWDGEIKEAEQQLTRDRLSEGDQCTQGSHQGGVEEQLVAASKGGMRDDHATTRSSLSFGQQEGEEEEEATAAGGEGPPSLSGDGTDTHLKRQVQSLLQRTDSMLSRSSDRSARQRGNSVSDLTNFPIGAGTGGPATLPSPIDTRVGAGGFGFLDEPPPEDGSAETPTLRSGGATPALPRSPSGARRRVVAFDGIGGAGAGSRASLASSSGPAYGGGGGIGGLSTTAVGGRGGVAASLPHRRRPSTSDTPDMHSPGSDVQGVGGLGGLSYAASSRSLSQAALSDLAEREQQLQPYSRSTGAAGPYDSGVSADRTTVVLGKSASFQMQRDRERGAAANAAAGSSGGGTGTGPGSGPYQSFAPLEDLVNAVTEAASVAAASRGPSIVGGGASQAAAPRSAGGASAASSGAPSVVRRGVLPMLQPEFISTAKISRLKAELAAVARSSLLPLATFDERLERVLARVLQFDELEGASARKFKVLLDSALDEAFARAAASGSRRAADGAGVKGGMVAAPSAGAAAPGALAGVAAAELAPLQQHNQPPPPQQPDRAGMHGGMSATTPPRSRRATQQAVLEVGAGSGALATVSLQAPVLHDKQQHQQQLQQQQQQVLIGQSAAQPPAAGADPVSTMQAAFAKLMAGQAALRGGIAADAPLDTAAAPVCIMGIPGIATGARTEGAGGRSSVAGAHQVGRRLSIGGSPEIGLSPAVSQTGSIAGAAGLALLAPPAPGDQTFAMPGTGGVHGGSMAAKPPPSRRGTRQQQVAAGLGYLNMFGAAAATPTTSSHIAALDVGGSTSSTECAAAGVTVGDAGAASRWDALQSVVAAIVAAGSPEPLDVRDELARRGISTARVASEPCPCCCSPIAALQHPSRLGQSAGGAASPLHQREPQAWQQHWQGQQQHDAPDGLADITPPSDMHNVSRDWRPAQLTGGPSWLASLCVRHSSNNGGPPASEAALQEDERAGGSHTSPAAACNTWLAGRLASSPAQRRLWPARAAAAATAELSSHPRSPGGWGQSIEMLGNKRQSPLQQQRQQQQQPQQQQMAPLPHLTATPSATRVRGSSSTSRSPVPVSPAQGCPRLCQQDGCGEEAMELTSKGPVRIMVTGIQQHSPQGGGPLGPGVADSKTHQYPQ